MKKDITSVLQILTPGAEYTVCGEKYAGIIWIKGNGYEKPTEEEIVQKIAELEYQEEVNEYQRQRAREYPSYADQFDQIFHEGVDAWKATVQAVKDKYPKQTMDADELQRRKDQALSELQQES